MGSMLENLVAYLETPEGKKEHEEFAKKIAKMHEIKLGRFDKFEKWLEANNFDNLIYRLILQHNDEYRESCYHKGYEPYLNNILSFIFDYVMENTLEVKPKSKKIKCDFPNFVHEFKGFYFQVIHGQGSICRIYNKEDSKLILSV